MTEIVHLQSLAARANSAHLAASGAAVSALEHARTAGEALNAAKGHVPHGEWLKWLDTHFDGSRDTAANYMRIAREWDALNVERVPHLTVRAAISSLATPSEARSKHPAIVALERSAEKLKQELIASSGYVDDGTGGMVSVADLPDDRQEAVLRSALAEETYERYQRQREHIKAHYENHDAQGRVVDRKRAFNGFVARKPCLRCGVFGVEVAHVRVILSPKTGLLLPRRNGLAEWGVVPLCPECHRHSPESIHNVGEQAFSDNLGRGTGYLVQAAATLIVEFFVGQREGSEV